MSTLNPNKGRGFSHLDDDGSDKLISGSTTGQIIAWDFKTGVQLHKLESKLQIMCVRVRWPLVVACTSSWTKYDIKYIINSIKFP